VSLAEIGSAERAGRGGHSATLAERAKVSVRERISSEGERLIDHAGLSEMAFSMACSAAVRAPPMLVTDVVALSIFACIASRVA